MSESTKALKRIADAIEEILRLVKADQEQYKKKGYNEKKEKKQIDNKDFDQFWEDEQKKEIEKYGDVNQGLGTWNGYEYVKTNEKKD